MRTSNPTMSESAFNRLAQGQVVTAPGPIARTDAFSVEGAIYKTLLLLGMAVLSGIATAVLLPESSYPAAIIGASVLGLPILLAAVGR